MKRLPIDRYLNGLGSNYINKIEKLYDDGESNIYIFDIDMDSHD
ncbi:hypothetical protein [Clostridium sp. 1001275B_160808_H3]|nr:hypothetical protein [Clostridium sp. 1001275B_160808_H3]